MASAGRAAGLAGLLTLLWLGVGVHRAAAHAFPERAVPGAGATLRAAPPQVRIWFDGAIEPAFSRLRVTTTGGERVDRGDSQVDPQDPRLLQITLPALSPGVYRVFWSALAVDGHRTEGDYTFTVKLPQ